MEIKPEWWRMVPQYFIKWFCLWNNSKRPRFGSKNWFFELFDPSKLNLNAPNPSERVPTIGPQCPWSIWKGPNFNLMLNQGHWPPIMWGLFWRIKGIGLQLDLNGYTQLLWKALASNYAGPFVGLGALRSNCAGPFWWIRGIGLQLCGTFCWLGGIGLKLCGTFLMAWGHWGLAMRDLLMNWRHWGPI